MEKKLVETSFKKSFGRKVYRTAWLVEYSIFALALSLAAFNLIFGISNGDIITGSLLAMGWLVLASIELATVPAAGSLRVGGLRNCFGCGIAVFGLWFLAAFTIFEFNEIASEYMTRGAREAAVEVDTLKAEIEDLNQEIENHRKVSEETARKIQENRLAEANEVEAENKRFETQEANNKSHYDGLIKRASHELSSGMYSAAEQSAIDELETEIVSLRAQLEQVQSSKNKIRDRIAEEKRLENESVQASFEGRLADIDSEIQRLENAEDEKIREAKDGLFGGREKKIARIQEETRLQIGSLQKEKAELRKELAQQIRIVYDSPELDDANERIALLDEEITDKKQSIDRIKDHVTARWNSPEYKANSANMESNLAQIKTDKEIAIEENRRLRAKNLNAIAGKYQALVANIEASGYTQAQAIRKTALLNTEIEEKSKSIKQIIEETSLQYEKTMYYRMASWFSDEDSSGFGVLPTKRDYNRSLQLIFGPIGIFYGFAAIALAFAGTGMVYDSDREEKDGTLKGGTEREKSLSKKLYWLKTQLVDYKDTKKHNEYLQKRVAHYEAAAIKSKCQMVDTVNSIPQTIIINGEEKNGKNGPQPDFLKRLLY